MAPTEPRSLLDTRAVCYGYNCNSSYYSPWNSYGRWILAVIVIVGFILLFFLLACVNSRRRRRRGVAPMYGTGWMANNNHQNNPNAYNNPPPAYGAPPGQNIPMQNQYTGNTFQPQDGYYGQHEGIQPPKDAHTHNNDYAPPAGPPPGKTTY